MLKAFAEVAEARLQGTLQPNAENGAPEQVSSFCDDGKTRRPTKPKASRAPIPDADIFVARSPQGREMKQKQTFTTVTALDGIRASLPSGRARPADTRSARRYPTTKMVTL